MYGKLGWVLTVGLTLSVLGGNVRSEIKVQPDKDNVVSSRLVGKWEADEEVTRRLGGRAGAFEFTSDDAIAAKIPEKFEAFLKDKTVYLAGRMKAGPMDAPYVLIEHKGNPYLVYFLPRDGDEFANPESMNVMLAVAKDTANDLLFLGGDFNNQPFGAHRRAKAEP